MKWDTVHEPTFDEVRDDLLKFLGAENIYDPLWRLRRFEISRIGPKLPDGGVLLDVGSGPGFIPRYFHKLGAGVISADFPGTGGLDALGDLIRRGIAGHYLQVGTEKLPLADDSVDVVFVGNVIEHLPHSPRPFLADLKRVLKPGGHLIVDTKNAVCLKTRLKLLGGISNWAPLERFYNDPINIHHHKEYTLSELGQAVEWSGFRNLERIAFEMFWQMSLKTYRGAQAMGAKADEKSRFGAGFNPWHPYEYARVLPLILTRFFPGLRSDIMVIGQK